MFLLGILYVAPRLPPALDDLADQSTQRLHNLHSPPLRHPPSLPNRPILGLRPCRNLDTSGMFHRRHKRLPPDPETPLPHHI